MRLSMLSEGEGMQMTDATDSQIIWLLLHFRAHLHWLLTDTIEDRDTNEQNNIIKIDGQHKSNRTDGQTERKIKMK